MNLKIAVKDNALMVTLSAVVTLAIGSVALFEGVDLLDRMHFTEAEAAEVQTENDNYHSSLDEQLAVQAALNECRWLADRITSLEYRIYVLKRDDASADFIQAQQVALGNYERKFNALTCAAKV